MTRPRLLGLAGLAVTALLILGLPVGEGVAPAAPLSTHVTSAFAVKLTQKVTNISYNASTDGFPLSYGEILPTNYNSSRAYPLIVYLHGKGVSSNWVRGGAGNGISTYQTLTGLPGMTLRQLIGNATTFNFIFIAPSPRSSTGFYTNSPCGGPEEQDTLDAIAHEEALHSISSVYLLGFSMGSLGAISLAGHHPGMFAGIALSGTITDPFQDLAYRPTGDTGLLNLTCDRVPSATNSSAAQLFDYLGVMRFDPQNFSGVRIWVSAGGRDIAATNNNATWPYQQVNDTFLTSTCFVASQYDEPANCTVPFQTLRSMDPALYPWRFVFEANGTHLLSQFDPHDLFEFLTGKEIGGCYTSTFPPTSLKSCP